MAKGCGVCRGVLVVGALLLLGIPLSVAQRPQSGFPTYVGTVSHSPGRVHHRRHGDSKFVELQGFQISGDWGMGGSFHPQNPSYPIGELGFHGSFGVEYQFRFFHHIGLSAGVALEAVKYNDVNPLQGVYAVERLRLSWEGDVLCVFTDILREVTGAYNEISMGVTVFHVGVRCGVINSIAAGGERMMYPYVGAVYIYPIARRR